MVWDEITAVTDEDMALINRFRPLGAAPLTAGEVASIPIVVADTTIGRSGDRWDRREIETMVRLVVGNAFMPDHDWDEVMGIEGKIYKSAIARIDPSAPSLDAIGLRGDNLQAALADGGIWACVAWAYLPSDSPWLDKIRFGAQKISLGGFYISHLECPICKTSFSDPNCQGAGHVPKTPDMRDPNTLSMWESAGFTIVPYAQMRGLYSSCEVSIVFAGMNPTATVITEEIAPFITIEASASERRVA